MFGEITGYKVALRMVIVGLIILILDYTVSGGSPLAALGGTLIGLSLLPFLIEFDERRKIAKMKVAKEIAMNIPLPPDIQEMCDYIGSDRSKLISLELYDKD